MAYTPTVWATGDVITAEKLNKAENGIAAADNVVLISGLEWVIVGTAHSLDFGVTHDELLEYFSEGKEVVIEIPQDSTYVPEMSGRIIWANDGGTLDPLGLFTPEALGVAQIVIDDDDPYHVGLAFTAK